MVVWGFGVGSYIGFLGLGFSVDGVWGLWCGAFWVFLGFGSLYEHKRINLGKNGACIIPDYKFQVAEKAVGSESYT